MSDAAHQTMQAGQRKQPHHASDGRRGPPAASFFLQRTEYMHARRLKEILSLVSSAELRLTEVMRAPDFGKLKANHIALVTQAFMLLDSCADEMAGEAEALEQAEAARENA
jgi:hypothetical protein